MFDAIMKWLAGICAAIMALFSTVTVGEINKPAPVPGPEYDIVNYIDGDSNLSGSVLYASEAKNQVQAVYSDAERSGYIMKNSVAQLYHGLTDTYPVSFFILDYPTPVKLGTLMTPDGNAYFDCALDAFYTDTSGGKYYASKTPNNARPNTIRLGEYYYESHIRDLKFENASKNLFWLDKGYHIYSDRLYQELALLASEATTKLASFGAETKVFEHTVNAIQIRDKDGIKNSLDDYDPATIEYVAFDIYGVGVAGFIIPPDGSTASTSIKLENGYYTVTQMADFTPGTGVKKNDMSGPSDYLTDVRFGSRIYNDETHDFDGIDRAAFLERNPLTGIIAGSGNSNNVYLGYEPLRGSYGFAMDGSDFNRAYYHEPDVHFAAPISITGDAEDRDIYIRMNGRSGGLEAGALLDGDGRMAAMNVQVCKNFQGDGGENFYSNPKTMDFQYGDSFFPISVKANETVDFTLLNLYQNWGKFPLKQLSSIEFHVSYYHLSTGVTESNCIAPYGVYGKDAWLLPDFRGPSGIMWSGQPQFNSVAKPMFMTYKGSLLNKDTVKGEYTGSNIKSSGLNYADIEYSYTADCGSYDYTLRHIEFPQQDENRTYYEVDITFNRDISFKNFKKDFSLFEYNSRDLVFTKSEYLDASNTPATKANKTGVFASTEYLVLGKDNPYFGYYDMAEKDAIKHATDGYGANMGVIVLDSEIISGGEVWDGNFVFRNNFDGKENNGALTLNAESLSFKAGDTISVQLILLPWGKVSEKQNGNLEAVRFDSAVNRYKAVAAVGEVLGDKIVPTVKADNNEAEFTLTGGKDKQSVRVNGFTSNECPSIEAFDGTNWVPVDLASANGYDGYTVYYDKYSGLYDFAFTYFAADPAAEYSFRCSQ
ncbi:MAG: hypothetical protein FWF08_02910 [Oscillospiraceae bacterium]|nr:hypothetical protein [Oscillospiraceae bacterium]